MTATFADQLRAFIDADLARSPVAATSIGDHRHDDRWPAAGEAARLERLAFVDHWEAIFRAFPDADLTVDEAVDRDLVLMELAAARFQDEDLHEERWNPLDWVYLLGDGLFLLISREFAPLADRLASVAGRLETMPALLDGAREVLACGQRPGIDVEA